jgi:hypothetical protein
MMMTKIGDTSNTNRTYDTPAVTKAQPSKLEVATGKTNSTPKGKNAENMVGITLFNPAEQAKQLLADNYTQKLNDDGGLRRDVLQPRIIDGQPTGELQSVTYNGLLGWHVFWTLEGIEVNTTEGKLDKQIELNTIKGILQDKKKFEKFRERLNIAESDETIKKELNLLIEFQSQYGSRSTLTIGEFREAYYDRDRSFHEDIKQNPAGYEILQNFW